MSLGALTKQPIVIKGVLLATDLCKTASLTSWKEKVFNLEQDWMNGQKEGWVGGATSDILAISAPYEIAPPHQGLQRRPVEPITA